MIIKINYYDKDFQLELHEPDMEELADALYGMLITIGFPPSVVEKRIVSSWLIESGRIKAEGETVTLPAEHLSSMIDAFLKPIDELTYRELESARAIARHYQKAYFDDEYTDPAVLAA